MLAVYESGEVRHVFTCPVPAVGLLLPSINDAKVLYRAARELSSGVHISSCTDRAGDIEHGLVCHFQRLTCPFVCPEQAQVEENLAKQAQVMEVIDREAAAYKQAFGYNEWRAACEASFCTLFEAESLSPPHKFQSVLLLF